MSFSIVFNLVTKQVQEFEVNTTEELFGWCRWGGAIVLNDAAETCGRCENSLFDS
ncbi:MAG: hypothetical protein NTZ04_06660 [Chloroflexi bacterium]|nr:hypothetical protein [Chloroflexota bacterium]